MNEQLNVDTVARTNKLDKVKLDILNRRQAVLDSLKQYQKYKNNGYSQKGIAELKIELNALYWECKQMIVNEIGNNKENDYSTIEELESDLSSSIEAKVLKAFNYIEKLLYAKRITAIDTRESMDPSDIFGMNRRGFY